jgi:hypothetical protein
MHELEPGFFTLGSLSMHSYTLRMTAEAFPVFPFGVPEGCRYTLEVHASRPPVGFITFDLLGEQKEFDTVVADLTEMLEVRVAGASRSRWRQKVRRQGCFPDVRNYVEPAAFARQGTVLWQFVRAQELIFRRRNKRLAGPHAL